MDPIPIAWVRVEPAASELREGRAAPAAETPAPRAAPAAKPEEPRRRPEPATPRRATEATKREAAPPASAMAASVSPPAEAGGSTGDEAGAAAVSPGDGAEGDAGGGEVAGDGARGAGGAAGGSGGAAGWMPRGGVQPPPAYPDVARRRGWEGTSHIALRLRASGSVAEVRLQRSAGHEPLDGAALAAVRRWRFEAPPAGARWNGVWFVVPIEFRLR